MLIYLESFFAIDERVSILLIMTEKNLQKANNVIKYS